LHPTNVLLYELWRYIFASLNINIDKHNFVFEKELIISWYQPFTTKMIKDLNILFESFADDQFYIERYNNYMNNKITNPV
jgi:hypothetical protein